MSRQRDSKDLPLFDLPLHGDVEDGDIEDGDVEGVVSPDAETAGGTSGDGHGSGTLEQSRLFEDGESGLDASSPQSGEYADEYADASDAVGVLDRLLGGIIDVGLHLAALLVVVVGAWLLGAGLRVEQWPAFAVFLLLFSLLYTGVPLAFWGQTPGMMRVGHVARTGDDQPLTFGQTALRWLGALLTLALAGLPVLLALGSSRSLADRISDSYTDLA